MNNRFICFTKLLAFNIFFFCHIAADAQKITGNIKNGTGDSVIFFDYYSGINFIKDSAVVKKNKLFSKNFHFANAKNILITYHVYHKWLYVSTNAKSDISFNAGNDSLFKNTFTVTGDDYFINHYLDTITKSNVYGNYFDNNVRRNQPIDSLAPVLNSFRKFSDSLRKKFFLQNIDQSRNYQSLHSFMNADSMNSYAYSILAAMDYTHLIRSGNQRVFWQNEVETRMPLSFSYADMNFEFYNRLWKYFFRNGYINALNSADSNQFKEMDLGSYAVNYIKSKNIENKLKELIASQVLYEILFHYKEESISEAKISDSSIAILETMINDKAFLKDFNKQYKETKSLVYSRLVGIDAPDFLLLDTAGRKYSLESFKGKIILIDVWASWCAPCVAEMPYMKAVEQKLKANKDFQLLTVSVDQSRQVWIKNGILKVKPPGLLLWKGSSEAFTKAYNIEIIPQLFLLDRNGKYIDFNPPRASDGNKLYELINKHLAE